MVPYDQMIKILGRWTITVEFVYTGTDSFIAASQESTIKPLTNPDGTPDQLAVDEYEDFVLNVLEIFDYYDFIVIESRQSPYSNSYYFSLVCKGDEARKDYKYILYVRVSDHSLSKYQIDSQNKYFGQHAQELKQPPTKSKQRWRVKRITVNRDTYYSYDEALDAIEQRFAAMQN